MKKQKLREVETQFKVHALCIGRCCLFRKMEIDVKYPG